ncbi:hypothetical protein [Streptomyces sp. ISL-100]|uniref:hypothetical protein n=1 Tax=Streptomyces sp. ISL-100 TaxID=2819173 RepID=UPI001BEA7732|nr:hypothetical protein [Streptomyces sp. ISL-100]MBT2395402.1 hypothetical protein [Streptomyces sp. ISL-100]
MTLTAALLAAGCGANGQGTGGAGPTASAGAVSDSADPGELARMQQFLDGADSAAGEAEADAAADE